MVAFVVKEPPPISDALNCKGATGVSRLWQPRAELLDLELTQHGQLMRFYAGGTIGPSNELVDRVFAEVKTGNVLLIKVPEETPILQPGCFGSNLLNFHLELSRELSARVVAETGCVSYHSRKLATEQSVTGFRTSFVKVLPPHYDLALHQPAHDREVFSPAQITLIAWGKRGPARADVKIVFFDVHGFQESGGCLDNGQCLSRVEPAIYCLHRGSDLHSQKGEKFRFSVTVPEGRISIFTNCGMAHGAPFEVFDCSRALNQELTRQQQGIGALREDIMVPIDVLLL